MSAHKRRHAGGPYLVVVAYLMLMSSVFVVATAPTTVEAANHSVEIRNFAFNPSSITIDPGDSVTWTNNDGTTHTVTSNDGTWTSGDLAPGGTYTHVFATKGNFSYHCSIHTYMTGVVHVGVSAGASGSSGVPTSAIVIIAIVVVAVVIVILAGVLMRKGRTGK